MSISDLFINGSLDDFKIYSKKWDWNKCLKYACIYNRVDIAEFAISNGAYVNSDEIMHRLCKGGNKVIAEMLIRNGSTMFTAGFVGACKSGYADIVELMLSKGIYDYREGLMYARVYGHKEIVECILSYFKNAYQICYFTVCYWKWVDLSYKYAFTYEVVDTCYDMLELFEIKNKQRIDVRVKLFDANLFSKLNERKNKRKYDEL